MENMITMVTPLHGYWVLLNTLEKFGQDMYTSIA